MAYVIGEVLVFLAAAALIGAVMAWLLRGLRSHARERRLAAEIEQAHSGREAAESAARSLETSLAELRMEMERETGRLKARIAELEALQRPLAATASGSGWLKEAASAGGRFSLRLIKQMADYIGRALKGLLRG
jgi:septal ring factor EnvC (AmiA/AmiB activator)